MRISDWSSDVCSSDLRRHWLGYLLLAPAVALIALIIIYPLFVSLDLSFQNVAIARLDQPRKAFTLANYERLFTSPEFWTACWVPFKLLVIVTSACFPLGLATALLVNTRFPCRAIARLSVAPPGPAPELIAAARFPWSC